MLRGEPPAGEPRLVERTYEACGGREHFLSYETPEGYLVGFLRLRFPPRALSQELEEASLLRELHIYGPQVPIGGESPGWPSWNTDGINRGFQHRGYGTRLVERAAELSREAGFRRLATMSGIGARPYYKRLGFERRGPYMVKDLEMM